MTEPTAAHEPPQPQPQPHPHPHGSGVGGARPDVWSRVRPLVFRTIIGAVVAAGLVSIVGVLVGDFGTVAYQLLLTVVVVVVFALLSWYDADVSSRRSNAFALVSVVTSLYLLVAGIGKVWIVVPAAVPAYGGDQYDPGYVADASRGWTITEQFWQWIGLVFVARVALLLVHLLLNIHRRYSTSALQAVAKITVGLIAVLALLLSLPLLFSHTHFADGYWRTVWVVVILVVLGTVVVPLSNALFRPRTPRPARTGIDGQYGYAPAMQPSAAQPWAGPPTGQRGPQPAGPQPWSEPGVVPVGGWAAVPPPAPVPSTTLPGTPAPGAAPLPGTTPVSGTPAPGTTPPPGLRYEPAPGPQRVLAWPRFVDGTPLPALADGTPDFSGVDHR